MNRRYFLGVSAWLAGPALLGVRRGLAPAAWAGGRLRGERKLVYLGKHLGSWAYPDPADVRRVDAILTEDAEKSCRKRYLGYDFPLLGHEPCVPGLDWFRAESLGAVDFKRSSDPSFVPDDREWYRVTLAVRGYYHAGPPRPHPLDARGVRSGSPEDWVLHG